jgi:mono/diheme cytochrome c family protein
MFLSHILLSKQKFNQPSSLQWLIILLLTGLILLFMAVPVALAAENGQALFEQSCASCHTLDGTGKGFAPDLKGVTEKRDRQWLVNWIAEPDKMIEKGDSIAQEILAKYNNVPMPNMGLTTEQSEAIVDYLAGKNQQALANYEQKLASEPIDSSTTINSETQITQVDPNPVAIAPSALEIKGQQFFIGTTRFANHAPSCNSCHSAGIGALNGGTLGPNLTHVFGRYGEIGLSTVLQTLPYPSMQGIYQDKPLTKEEQTALLAFLKQQDSVDKQPTETNNFLIALTPSIKFILIGLAGCLLLLIISKWTWCDRFTGVRNKLVEGKQ